LLDDELFGRVCATYLSGLRLRGFRQNRALPYPIDNKAFSLSLTVMGISPDAGVGVIGLHAFGKNFSYF